MKRLIPIAVLLFCIFSARAGIVGTNIVNLAAYTAGTNTSASFVPPQSHSINPATYTFYHSATNCSSFPTTNVLQVTFDGGITWANVAIYVNTPSIQNEIWTVPSTTLTASNRMLTITTTNQTLYTQANWIQ